MSDFEDSDLTDLDDEEDFSLSQLHPKKKRTDEDSYRIRGALTAPRATSYTTQALHEMLEQADINLEADYQRDIVWPPAKQVGLIDSIFKNFYVPPVIFAVTYSSDGTEKRVCIDGKQRLTSIWRFMQGTIPFKDSLTGEKFFYKDNPERTEKGKQRMLPDRYRKVFRTKQIVCVEYTDLNPDSEREIFQRVQLGMALNVAEKLQAIHGPTPTFIRSLLEDFIHDELETSMEWDTSRANDFRCVSTAVFMMEKFPCKLPTVPTLTKWLQDTRELEEDFVENIRSTYKIFAALARSPDHRSCFHMEDARDKKGTKTLKVAPAEFIMAAVLIHHHKRKLTLLQLSEGIRKMRNDVRRVEVDIRTNSRVFNHMLTVIKDLKPSKMKNDIDKPAAVAGVDLYTSRAKKDGRQDSPPPTARKRKAKDDSDGDSDYVESRKAVPSSRKKPSSTRPEPRTPPPKSSPQSSRAPPPKPSSTPQKPSYSQQDAAPPPYSTQPPSGPQIHPDRLAAIKSAKEIPTGPSHNSSANSWDGVGMRFGPGPLASASLPPAPPSLPPPPPPHQQDNLGQSLMARMGGSYKPASHPVAPMAVDPPYDPRRPAPTSFPRKGRDDYGGRGTNNSQWGQRQW